MGRYEKENQRGTGEMRNKLELGCGETVEEGYIGIDKNTNGENIKQIDLEEIDRLPFDDNRFKYVNAENVLEHLNMESYKNIMREIARVTEEGSYVDISGPHYLNWNAPAGDHYRAFSQQSFVCFCVDHEYPTSFPQRYSLVERNYFWRDNPIVKAARFILPDAYVRQHLPNSVEEIKFRLRVESEERWK